MRVLVAGASGYLGRFVTRSFKQKGHTVRALVRNPAKLQIPGPFLEPAVLDYVDEVFAADVTKPDTLVEACRNIEVVFSSVGITRQREGLTFHDVDYKGNLNLLEEARRHSVSKFVYVSVFNAHLYEHLAIIKAHEDFVRALQASNLPATVIRPTGYFSDLSEILQMARRGRVFLIGRGTNRLNPIHGADLADVCTEAPFRQEEEIPVGGPEVLSQNDAARMAFAVLGKKEKITHLPQFVGNLAVRLIRPFNRHLADLADFIVSAGQGEGIAPAYGNHRLEDYYRQMYRSWES